MPGPGFYDCYSHNRSNGVQSVFKSRSPKHLLVNQASSEQNSLKGRVLSSDNDVLRDLSLQ